VSVDADCLPDPDTLSRFSSSLSMSSSAICQPPWFVIWKTDPMAYRHAPRARGPLATGEPAETAARKSTGRCEPRRSAAAVDDCASEVHGEERVAAVPKNRGRVVRGFAISLICSLHVVPDEVAVAGGAEPPAAYLTTSGSARKVGRLEEAT
jgi:hypothetical protein